MSDEQIKLEALKIAISWADHAPVYVFEDGTESEWSLDSAWEFAQSIFNWVKGVEE